MNELMRGLVAGSVGAVVAVTVVVGQPAIAEVRANAAKDSVTSKSIKNGAVKTKDLSPEVSGPLAQARTALQSVPDGSVTTPKLANGAVGSAKVADGSLRAADIAVRTGAEPIDWASLAPGNCVATGAIETGQVVTGDFFLVSQPAGIAGNLHFSAREDPTSPTAINIVQCNNGNSTFNAPYAVYSWAVIDR